MSEIFYSTIFHDARKRMGLSNDEFVLCDYVFKWQSNPRAPRPGWCSKTRNQIGEHIGSSNPDVPMSRRGVQKMIDRMVDKKLLEVDPITRDIRATTAWFDNVVAENERLARPIKIGPRPDEMEHATPEPTADESFQPTPDENPVIIEIGGDGCEQSSRGGVNKVHGGCEQSSRGGVEDKEVSKKVSKKGIKAAVKNSPPAVIHRMVEVFETEHKKYFLDEMGAWVGFVWSGKEFVGLDGLRKKLSKRFNEKMQRTPTDDEIIASFTLFLQRAVEADQFYLKLFTPCAINGQFQNVINRIYGKQNPTNPSPKVSNRVNGTDFFSGYGMPNQE